MAFVALLLGMAIQSRKADGGEALPLENRGVYVSLLATAVGVFWTQIAS
jgi:hypothetical protein